MTPSTRSLQDLRSQQHDMEADKLLEMDDDEDSSAQDMNMVRSSSRNMLFLTLNGMMLLFSVLFSISAGWTAGPTCISTTDMLDAHSAIRYERRNYTGALKYDSQTRSVFRERDAEMEYFGPPSQEVDDAWKELLHGEFPIMTETEAASYQPALRRIPKTGHFHFEPDMFHTLHCVNAIRIALSEPLYNITSSHKQGSFQWRVTHCLDRIRQAVVCAGVLTSSPSHFWDRFDVALGRTGEHSYRKWQPIRDWMDRRGRVGPILEED